MKRFRELALTVVCLLTLIFAVSNWIMLRELVGA